MAWKVPSHGMPSTTWPIIAPMRIFISRAALLVKVTARISRGCARPRLRMWRDAGRQHARLAGAGAGQHQHRAVEGLDREPLLGVEVVEIGEAAARLPPSRARRCRPGRARRQVALVLLVGSLSSARPFRFRAAAARPTTRFDARILRPQDGTCGRRNGEGCPFCHSGRDAQRAKPEHPATSWLVICDIGRRRLRRLSRTMTSIRAAR